MDRYFAPEKLGPNRAKTPEGFLVCYDVPVARLGSQEYAPEELAALPQKIEPGSNGMISVARTAEELFRPDSLATLNGKDVVDEHPEDDPDRTFDIEPDNFRFLTRGVVMNPRRGKGADEDVILCDLLVKDKSAIEAVEQGKVEVSAGYRAQYFKLGPGKVEQRNIFFNHVALVEAGRCGSRCSIRDHKPRNKEQPMAKQEKGWIDRVRDAFKTKDEKAFEEAMKEAKTGDSDESVPTTKNGIPEIHIHNNMGPGPAGVDNPPGTGNRAGAKDEAAPGEGEEDMPDYFKKHVAENKARFAAHDEQFKKFGDSLEEMKGMLSKGTGGDTVDADPNKDIADELEKEAPAEAMPDDKTKDSVRKARDSANLEYAFDQMVADSEVILPGVSIPAFVRDAAPTVTYPSMCKHRRAVLEMAWVQPATRPIIEEVLAGKNFELSGMHCSKVRDMFSAVATARRAANRVMPFNAARDERDERRDAASEVPRDNASFNDYAAKFYGNNQTVQ